MEEEKEVVPLVVSGRVLSGDVRKPTFADVEEAYLRTPARGDKYIQLPEENVDEGVCGRPNVTLYGTRNAARNRGVVAAPLPARGARPAVGDTRRRDHRRRRKREPDLVRKGVALEENRFLRKGVALRCEKALRLVRKGVGSKRRCVRSQS